MARSIDLFSAFRVQKVRPRLLPRPRVHPHCLRHRNPIPRLIARRAQRALPRRQPVTQPAAVVVGTTTALNTRHLEGIRVLEFTRVRLLRFGESAREARGIAVVDGNDVGREDAGEVVAHEWLENDDRRAHDADVELNGRPNCGASLGIGDVGVVRKGHDVGNTDDADDHHTVVRRVSGLRRVLVWEVGAYKILVEKMPARMAFWVVGSFSVRTMRIGSRMLRKSVMMLRMACHRPQSLRQSPVLGLRGEQGKAMTRLMVRV